jgi:hypothetical protein
MWQPRSLLPLTSRPVVAERHGASHEPSRSDLQTFLLTLYEFPHYKFTEINPLLGRVTRSGSLTCSSAIHGNIIFVYIHRYIKPVKGWRFKRAETHATPHNAAFTKRVLQLQYLGWCVTPPKRTTPLFISVIYNDACNKHKGVELVTASMQPSQI